MTMACTIASTNTMVVAISIADTVGTSPHGPSSIVHYQKKYTSRIARGGYISFDKLTIPEKHQEKHTTKRSKKLVSGLSSWLEAWNRYVGMVLALNPSRALEMLNYQTLITTAFRDYYPVEACIEYDRRFRQLAAKDKTIAWNKIQRGHLCLVFLTKPNIGNSLKQCQSFRFAKPAILA